MPEEEQTEIVTYLVPVEVTVNVEDRSVVRVVLGLDGGRLLAASASEAAQEIAENSEWPPVEHGS